MQPGSGRLRIARGGALAALCLLIAATGHAGAGGALPPLGPLLAIGALIGGAFVLLADRERGLGAIMLAAVGSQLLFHAGFEMAVPQGRAAHVGHDGHASTGAAVPDGVAGTPLGVLVETLPGDEMLLAHLAGAVVLAVLARHGESLLWGLARLFGITRIPSLLPVAPIRRCTPATPRPRTPLLEPRARVEARIRPRRGPPRAGVPTRLPESASFIRTKGFLLSCSEHEYRQSAGAGSSPRLRPRPCSRAARRTRTSP